MLDNMEFDAPINFIYHRDVYGVIRKLFAFAPVSKNAEGKYDKYVIVSVKKTDGDKDNKDIARAYAIAKIIKYYKIYSDLHAEHRDNKTVKASFAKKGVRIITFPELKAMRVRAAEHNVAVEEIRKLTTKLVSKKYLNRFSSFNY